MLGVLNYIWSKNRGISRVKYLIFGLIFQVFKRITKSVVSITIFNSKKLFCIPIAMYQVCMLIQVYLIKKK